MAKFVVDRKMWYRGKGSDTSRLLNAEGQRCCIGFVGQQCNIADEYMLNLPDIDSAHEEHSVKDQFPAWMHGDKRSRLLGYESTAIFTAYHINDDTEIPDNEREEKLKQVFAEFGDEIEFTN